jgi:hypothetical protein
LLTYLTRSFEAAYYTTLTPRLSKRVLSALDKFLNENIQALKDCLKEPVLNSGSNSIEYGGEDATRVKQDSEKLSQILGISGQTALAVVLRFNEHANSKLSERLMNYTRFYCAEERYKIKLVAELLRLRASTPANQERKDQLVSMLKGHSIELLVETSFFSDIISTAKRRFSLRLDRSEFDAINNLRKTEVCCEIIQTELFTLFKTN